MEILFIIIPMGFWVALESYTQEDTRRFALIKKLIRHYNKKEKHVRKQLTGRTRGN